MKVSVAITSLLALTALAGCEERASWAEASLERSVCAPALVALAESLPPQAAPAAKADASTTTASTMVNPQGSSQGRAEDTADDREDDEPEIDFDAPLKVKRLMVAEGVAKREPVGAATTFEAGKGRIYAFVEIGNPERANSEIFVSITPQGKRERGRVRLRIGPSPRWRTWSFTRLADEPGVYEVVVRDAQREEIGRTAFEVTAKDAPVPTAKNDSAEQSDEKATQTDQKDG